MGAKEYREELTKRIKDVYGIDISKSKTAIRFCLKMFREGFEIEFIITRLEEQYGLIKIKYNE
tara:strand:+ start:253 stop:441 length:189 start_codon:yes stop_codon:yes gene_type:complete